MKAAALAKHSVEVLNEISGIFQPDRYTEHTVAGEAAIGVELGSGQVK